jgi:DNA-binding response OmpR family regulator
MAMVFMAEDDPLMISIYSQILKANGFDMKMATDGEQAIADLTAMPQKPEVVILDVMMPKKDGFEVMKAMKADANLKNIPVIFLTNLSSKEDLQKGFDLGAEMCLVKSQYGPDEIATKVKEVYDKHHQK